VALAVLLAAALAARSLLDRPAPAVAPDGLVRVIRPPASPKGPLESREQAAAPAELEPRRRASEGEPHRPGLEPYVRLRRGGRVLLRDQPGGRVLARIDDRTQFGSPTVLSVVRARRGWLGVPAPELPNGELGWLRADPAKLLGGYTDIRVEVDLSRHLASIRKDGRLVRSWAVTVGAPATPTPTGTFAVTDLIEDGLNPAYGCCAVALTAKQPELPSGWDGGNRIAFHGTDGLLGIDASSGCVRSADADVRALIRRVPLGAPVRIHE